MKRREKLRPVIYILLLAAMILFAGLGLVSYLSFRPTEPVTQENITDVGFSWWGNDSRHAYTLDGIDLFEEEHPEIRVRYQFGVWDGFEKRTQMSMLSHTEDDVMQINYAWIRQYSPDGTGYYDLNRLSDVIDLSNYSEEDLSYGTVDGKLNALPIAYNMPVFYYNQDILDTYGLSVPETWDDLFAAAEVMRDDGIYPLGVVKKQLWMLIVAHYEQETGEKAFSEDGTFQADADGVKEMLTFYKRLLDEKVIMPVDDFNQQFQTGKAAGVQIWISDADRYAQELADTGAKVVHGPNLTMSGSGMDGWYMKPATMYAISSITKHPEEAGELLNFLLNDPDMAVLQGSEKGMPVSKAARAAVEESGTANAYEEEGNDYLLARQSELELIAPEMENDSLISTFKNEADKYLYNQEDLDTCAQAIVEGIKDLEEQ